VTGLPWPWPWLLLLAARRALLLLLLLPLLPLLLLLLLAALGPAAAGRGIAEMLPLAWCLAAATPARLTAASQGSSGAAATTASAS
jgi:hypothetical protein